MVNPNVAAELNDWSGIDPEAAADDVLDVEAIEVASSTAITAIERAQIDIQIATAHQFPRDTRSALRELVTLCTLDVETAESMTYALKRKDESGQTKYIVGPSVRFAEMVVHAMGNVRAGGRIVAIDDTMITGQGVCHDLEKNVAVSIEARRRITNKKGKRYNDDMIVTTGNAAVAIGFRNAVFKVFPMALCKKAWESARAMASGAGVPIEQRRKRALDWFAAYGKKESDVLRVLGKTKVEEIGEEQIEILNGLRVGVQEGTQTIPGIFDEEEGETRSEGATRLNATLAAPAAPADKATRGRALDAKHKLYMRAMRSALDENEITAESDREDWRRTWQETHIEKRSTKDWTDADYSRAIQMLEAGIGL